MVPDLYPLNVLVWLHYAALQFFTLHPCLGAVCVQPVSKGLWTGMSIPKMLLKNRVTQG